MPKSLLAPELNPEDEIQFLADHRVSVPAGDYTIDVEQLIKIKVPPWSKNKEYAVGDVVSYGLGLVRYCCIKTKNKNMKPTNSKFWVAEKFTCSHEFSVLPERFELNPRTINSVFPPAGSRGDFQADLPHIILNRSTLPWERTARYLAETDKPDMAKDPPWLGLLLFYQDEAANLPPLTVKAKIKEGSTTSPPFFPKQILESGQHADDLVQVIDVRKGLLSEILPRDLDYHVHARRRLAILKRKDTPSSPRLDDASARAVLKAALAPPSTPPLNTDAPADAQAGLKAAVESFLCKQIPKITDKGISKPQRWHFRDLAQHAEYEVWYDSSGKTPAWNAYRVDVETAVILGNRLPQPGCRNVVHLVSLEGRFHWENETWKFDFQGAGENDSIRLISLHNWEFFCENPAHNFTGLLEGLNRQNVDVVGGKLNAGRLVNAIVDVKGKSLKEDSKEVAKITGGDWTKAKRVINGVVVGQDGGQLQDLNGTIRLETNQASSSFGLPASVAANVNGSNEPAASYLRAGFVPMRHFFRQGDRSVSWYHGPLVPAEPTKDANSILQLPVAATDNNGKSAPGPQLPFTADQLLIYDETSQMFDASYAAAWELGRMLTLQSRKVALSLFNWKRRHAALLKNAAMVSEEFLLKAPRSSNAEDAFPKDVHDWFHELSHLVHVPFQYLVPDERLLPPESIRFFSVDPIWLECLCDGAFTVGRVLQNDHVRDKNLRGKARELAKKNGSVYNGDHSKMSGFLLRSEVVSGWPGLRVDASSERQDDENPMNRKKAAPSAYGSLVEKCAALPVRR